MYQLLLQVVLTTGVKGLRPFSDRHTITMTLNSYSKYDVKSFLLNSIFVMHTLAESML